MECGVNLSTDEVIWQLIQTDSIKDICMYTVRDEDSINIMYGASIFVNSVMYYNSINEISVVKQNNTVTISTRTANCCIRRTGK